MCAAGSSPLARGPRAHVGCEVDGAGLIPARAGTTAGLGHTKVSVWAHPRSRGDHDISVLFTAPQKGSSPLARGPPCLDAFHNYAAGLIPARAGTTTVFEPCGTGPGAHPRSRGDHGTAQPNLDNYKGSSPLARGPPRNAQAPQEQPGLIPARAGTTGGDLHVDALAGAHPRSRGDHPNSTRGAENLTGSSPLARGPPVNSSAHRSERGLIPARAGTTLVKKFFLTCAGAHPRSRGDHLVSWTGLMALWGSSPLARGPRVLRLPQSPRPGLIPARAGTTLCWRRASLRGWAHPRSRGDHRIFVSRL